MEIKKRLNKIAKRMTPEIEAMNIGIEMQRMCTRFEELASYGEEKVAKSKLGGKSSGQIIAEERAAERKRIADIHAAESDENMQDQQQASAEIDPRTIPIPAEDEPVTEEGDAGGEPAQAEQV